MMAQIGKDGEYTQMSYQTGIKKHENLAVKAMLHEWAQLDEDKKQLDETMALMNGRLSIRLFEVATQSIEAQHSTAP